MRSADDPIEKIISTLDSIPIEGSSKLITLSPGKFGIDFIDDFFKYVVEADSLSVSQAEKEITDTTASISGISTLRGYTDLGITLDFRVKDDEVVITLYGSLKTTTSLLQGIFPWISVNLLGITVAFHQQFSILSILYHVDIVIGQTNALAVPVDISALENKYWQLSIAEEAEKPISLDQVASLMCGFLPSSFFPESFSGALSGLQMNGISAIFNADSNEVISISAGIAVTNGWDIAPKISLMPGLQLIFTLNNPTNEYARQFVGIVRGIFAIDSVNVPVFVQVNLERDGSTWMIGLDPESEGVTLPSISSLFSLAGGEDFKDSLPEGLRNIPAINVSRLEVDFSPAKKNFDLITFAANTATPWVVIDGFLTLQSLSFQLELINLNIPSERKIGCFLHSTFSITDLVWIYFNVDKDAQSTDWVLSGGLPSGKTLNLTDLARVMLHDLVVIPEEAPDISFDTLDIRVIPGKSMDFTAGSKSEWALIPEKLSINAFTFNFNYNNLALPPKSKFSGSLYAEITIAKIPIQLSTKIDASGSWSFDGSTAKGQKILIGELISDLLEKFEVTVPDPLKSLSLQDLSVHFLGASRGESGFKEFSAGCVGIFSLFGADMQAKVNIDLKRNAGSLASSPTYSTKIAGSLVLYLANGSCQTFTLEFSQNLQEKKFTASWKASPGNELSIGGIVETLISWITGEVFGLAPPWDFLNNIRFGSVSFSFDLNSKEMTVAIPLQPIDFGIGRIDGFSIAYLPSDIPNGRTKGVYVKLDGTFSWVTDSSKPLEWNAADPNSTLAPPGGKFLDLRLLALGQHVGVTGLKNINKVQDAIKALKGLPTDPDKLMEALSAGCPIAFDPDSSWLVAADFGILRFDKPTTPSAPALLGERSLVGTTPTSGYLLNLSLIFNDPNLYGLRLALDGPAAKIFAGLALEIMYRKISDTLGVFQTELKLPDAMRSFEAGVFTITLPVLALEIYTNGDFKIDLGFPWNMDFSRSFMIQGIVPPGIPVLGAGGLYFGKLSSGSSTQVPRATNGNFNPVIIFGIGLKLGVGKEIDKGVFKAGISITIVGIIEGVIAKWNPNGPAKVSGNDIQDSYYFWLQGTLGIVGKLFGSVDFGVVKAAVNVQLALYAQITYESYANIPISVIASVSVSLSLEINLGLFKIKLNFSFSITIKQTFVIQNPQSGKAPWQVAPRGVRSSLAEKHAGRLRSISRLRSADSRITALNWDNYQPSAQKIGLKGYLVPVLTASGTDACYVVTLLLDDENYVTSCQVDGTNVQITSFQALCIQVLKWVIASSLSGSQTEDDIDEHIVTDSDLIDILENCLASGDEGISPIVNDNINSFMAGRFLLELKGLDSNSAATEEDKNAGGIFFPMPPDLTIEVLPFNGKEGLRYRFSNSNKVDRSTLKNLREFFSRLAVQVEKEMMKEPSMQISSNSSEYITMTTFVFEDYFLLLARQMVQIARDVLRNFKYTIKSGDSINSILGWININGGNTVTGALTAQDIMEANSQQTLKEGIVLSLGAEHILFSGDTLADIARKASLDIMQLASYNSDNEDILLSGAVITYTDPEANTSKSYTIQSGDTLASLTGTLERTFGQVVSIIESAPSGAALKPSGKVYLPAINYRASYSDTLSSLAGSFSEKYYKNNSHYDDILKRLAAGNAWVEGILKPGSILEIGDKKHTIALEDSLHSLAQFFGYLPNRFDDFVSNDNVKGTALNPLALLMLPEISYEVSDEESLGSISKGLGITVGTLAQNSQNLAVPDIFDTGEVIIRINLPHLNRLKLKEISSHILREESLNHLGGMASRYMLHGICLPHQRMSHEIIEDDTFNSITSDNGNFDLMDLVRANADLTDILTAGTKLTYKDSDDNDKTYVVKSGDSLSSIAGSISQVLGGSPLTLKDLLDKTGLESKEGLLLNSAVLDIPLIAFQEPFDEEAGLYQLTGQQFSAPDLSAQGEYSFILHKGEEAAWIPIQDGGLKTVIKNDVAEGSTTTGYDLNIIAAGNIRQAILEWDDQIIANHDWWDKDICEPQKLGVGSVYKLQPKKYPFPTMAIWQSPEDVRLYLGRDIDDTAGRLADKGLLKIWPLPDSLMDLTCRATGLPGISLYAGTFNDATSVTDEEMVTPYSWGTIINFTVKKVAGYSTPGQTYEILGANERGIALLESLLKALHESDSGVKDMAILYKASRAGVGTECLQSDGPLKQSVDVSDDNKISTLIYQVNLTTVTLPADTSAMVSADPSLQSKTFADLQYGQCWDYLRLLWEGSITRSGGYYLYYCQIGDNTGLPDAIFNEKGEAVISLLIIYNSEEIAGYMNCAITGDQIDPSRSVVFASGSETSSCTEENGLAMRVPLVSPGIIPLEVKRKKSTDGEKGYLTNMFNMLSYSVQLSEDFEESDPGLPMGPIGSDDDAIWVYHQALPYASMAKIKPAAIEVHKDASKVVSIESPYAAIGKPLHLKLIWQDIFGNRIECIPDGNCQIPTGYTDALMGLSQWPGMACHYGLRWDPEQDKSYFRIEFDFNTDGYLLEQENNPSIEEIDAVKDNRAWHDLLAYARIYYQLLDAALSVETSLRLPNMANLAKKGSTPCVHLKDSLLKWIWDDTNSPSIISYLSDCLAQGCIGTVTSKPATPLIMELEFDPAIIRHDAIFKLSVDLIIRRHPAKVHPDFRSTDLVLLASTPLSPLRSNQYVFSWDNVPGTDDIRLREFLIKTYGINWINTGEFLKSADANIISLSSEDKTHSLTLEKNVSEVILKIDNNITDKYIIREEESELNIYSDHSQQDFAKAFEEATKTDECRLKIATGIDRLDFGRSSLWVVRISNPSVPPTGSIKFGVNSSSLPMIFAPRPLFNRPVNLNDVVICDYIPGSGISAEKTRTVSFAGVDVDAWLRIFLNGVEKFLSPEFATPIVILGERNETFFIDNLIESKKTIAKGLSRLLVPALKNTETYGLTETQKVFEEDLLIHLSNFYSTEAAIQFDAHLNYPSVPEDKELRLFGPVAPGTAAGKSISLTAAKMALKEETTDSNDENALLTFLLHKHEGFMEDGSGVNSRSLLFSPVYQITNIEHQIEAMPEIEEYQASSWLTFANTQDPMLQIPLGSFEVPLILRALPTPPSMVEQRGSPSSDSSDDSLQSDSSGLDVAMDFDYSLIYSRDYHEPQDDVHFTMVFNKNLVGDAARSSEEGIEYKLAKFVTVYPDIEADLEEKLKGVSAETELNDPGAAIIALEAFVKLVGDVAEVFKSAGALRSNAIPVVSGQICKFCIRECASQEPSSMDALAIKVLKDDDNWPEDLPLPEVLIEGYTREENTKEESLYKKSDGISYLTASEGRKIPGRRVVLPLLNILSVQDITSSASINRNNFAVNLNTGTTGSEYIREVDSPFRYTTSEVSFANPYRPFIDSYSEVDISKIESNDGQSSYRSLEDHLKALFERLLGGNAASTLNIQMECDYCLRVQQDMPELSLPMLLRPYVSLTLSDKQCVPELSQAFSNCIHQWVKANLARYDQGTLRFDLTISTGMTKTSMPLLKLHNLRLATRNIAFG